MSRNIPDKVVNACMHKTASKGGLDVGQMRIALSELYPDKDFSGTRKDLEMFCNEEEDLVNAVKAKKYRYFKSNSELNELEKEYCRCVADDGQGCVGDVDCSKEYDLRHMPDSYFTSDSPLDEQEEKYCRCVAHVSAKSSAYNPYAVCTASVGRVGKVRCAPYYNYDRMPAEEVEALARNKGITVDEMKRKSKVERTKL